VRKVIQVASVTVARGRGGGESEVVVEEGGRLRAAGDLLSKESAKARQGRDIFVWERALKRWLES